MAAGQPHHGRDRVLGLQGRKPPLAPLEGLLSARLVRILQMLKSDLSGVGSLWLPPAPFGGLWSRCQGRTARAFFAGSHRADVSVT